MLLSKIKTSGNKVKRFKSKMEAYTENITDAISLS